MDWKNSLRQDIKLKDMVRATTVPITRLYSMFRAITDPNKLLGRSLAVYWIHRLRKFLEISPYSHYYASIQFLQNTLGNSEYLNPILEGLSSVSNVDFVNWSIPFLETFGRYSTEVNDFVEKVKNRWSARTSIEEEPVETETREEPVVITYKGFFQPYTGENMDEDWEDIEEAYSEEELDDLIGKTFNLQKIENIYRRKKYDTPQLFAHTRCTKCGRHKRVFLSNLVNDPDKYGSCICSDENIDSRIDNAEKLYTNKKRLSTNTSGYTGVSFVKNYGNAPYNKWRAYIEVDGTRTYLGDFDTKKEAIKARKEAGEKGIKWYKENRSKLVKNVRRRTKKYQTSKYRDTLEKTKVEVDKK